MKQFLYTEGKLIASTQAETFKDDKGEDVVYFENQILTPDGVLQMNSKGTFEDSVGEEGVAKVACRQLYNESGNIKGHKLTLAGFTPGEAIDEAVK